MIYFDRNNRKHDAKDKEIILSFLEALKLWVRLVFLSITLVQDHQVYLNRLIRHHPCPYLPFQAFLPFRACRPFLPYRAYLPFLQGSLASGRDHNLQVPYHLPQPPHPHQPTYSNQFAHTDSSQPLSTTWAKTPFPDAS